MANDATTDLREAPLDTRFARHLAANGQRLGRRAKAFVLGHGAAAVEPLIALACEGGYDEADSPGEGWVAIHAVRLLGHIRDLRAVEPLVELVARLDTQDILYSEVIRTLSDFGSPVVEPALRACDAGGDDARDALAEVFARCGARDERILTLLLGNLEREPELGAVALADYGDPAALPAIYQAFEAWLAKPPKTLGGIRGVHDFLDAIETLGGGVPDHLAQRVETVVEGQRRRRQQLLGGSGLLGRKSRR